MPSKYQKTILEIQASDELKKRIKRSLEQEKLKHSKKGVFIKFKRALIATSATLATLVCGGAVYAALGGTINGVSVAEWLGIKFSPNYSKYEEKVKNQYIENEYGKIELQSTVCDDGFTILKFNIKIKDIQKIRENIFKGDWSETEIDKENLQYKLHFNDVLPEESDEVKNYSAISENNNNLIINGKKYYINGSVQSTEEIIQNYEYNFYQMWFLTEEELKSLETFTITLNNIALQVNGTYYKFKDSFNIELSKSKAKENTKEIHTKNDYITYHNMQKALSEVKVTPLQNIVKLSTTRTNADYNCLCHLLDENYVGNLEYRVTDQDGKELRSYNVETSREIIYSDGRKEKIKLGDIYNYDENLKNAIIKSTEYIAIEEVENIKELNIEVMEFNSYYGTIKNIGKYTINLVEEKTKAENKNEIIEQKAIKTQENSTFTSDIQTSTSSNIEWEEYPSNFNKQFSKVFEDNEINAINKKAIKTLYSIVKNNLYNDLDVYSMGMIVTAGDDWNITIQETNYNQYDYNSEDTSIRKYTNAIKFKVAKISPTYLAISENNDLKDITRQTKKQYELLQAQNYHKDTEYYFSLDKMVIMNGNNLSKETYKNNSRAKKIKITVNNDKEYILDLKDTNKAQVFDLNYKQQTIAKPIDIKVEILETYSGEKTNDIFISDIHFNVTTNISMGI